MRFDYKCNLVSALREKRRLKMETININVDLQIQITIYTPSVYNTNTGKQNDQFIFTNRIFQHDSVTTLIFTITSVDGLNNHEIISIRLVAIRMLRENIHSFHAIKWQRYGPALNTLLLPRSADFLASWLCFVLTIDSKCWYLMLCKLMRNIFQIAPINRFSRRKFVGISTFWNECSWLVRIKILLTRSTKGMLWVSIFS